MPARRRIQHVELLGVAERTMPPTQVALWLRPVASGSRGPGCGVVDA